MRTAPSSELSAEPFAVDRLGDLVKVGSKVDVYAPTGVKLCGPHTVTKVYRYERSGADLRLDAMPPFGLVFASAVQVVKT